MTEKRNFYQSLSRYFFPERLGRKSQNSKIDYLNLSATIVGAVFGTIVGVFGAMEVYVLLLSRF